MNVSENARGRPPSTVEVVTYWHHGNHHAEWEEDYETVLRRTSALERDGVIRHHRYIYKATNENCPLNKLSNSQSRGYPFLPYNTGLTCVRQRANKVIQIPVEWKRRRFVSKALHTYVARVTVRKENVNKLNLNTGFVNGHDAEPPSETGDTAFDSKQTGCSFFNYRFIILYCIQNFRTAQQKSVTF